jgi:hypothetical protein
MSEGIGGPAHRIDPRIKIGQLLAREVHDDQRVKVDVRFLCNGLYLFCRCRSGIAGSFLLGLCRFYRYV